MSLLEGKKALVFGIANERSIAWGIAKQLHAQGADVGLSYAVEALARRAKPLAEQLGTDFVEECDVTDDAAIEAVAKKAKKKYGQIDILVHSIAFAGRDELKGFYYDVGREAFLRTMEISVYSFTRLAGAYAAILAPRASLMTMTYYASQKSVPNYNVMGVAKAALEASVRYLARDLGPRQIRVNAISAGPIRTLSAAGVSGFRSMYKQFAEVAPLRENISAEDVGDAAVFLASELSQHITGEVLYVDSGFNTIGIAAESEGDE